MTVTKLHKILIDENRKITLKEYQKILYHLKSNAIDVQVKYIRRGIHNDPKFSWYNGKMVRFKQTY